MNDIKNKNACQNCIHNNLKKAKSMFYKNYCELLECQTSGDKKCRNKKIKQ
jgi:hypothetical protein